MALGSDGPSSRAVDLPDARELLAGLIGKEILTVTGAKNTVLDLRERDVVVGTARSPAGTAVPLEWVQAGIDALARDGEVTVDTDTLHHRSAFVGAVLLTIPGARVSGAAPPRVMLESPPPVWTIRPGDSIRRTELHDVYGGSRQGGMTASTKTPNILLFLDRRVGSTHGYYDGWVGEHLYYTGHGQRGDQEFRSTNAALLRHRDDGRVVRVFRGAGGHVTYLGELRLDESQPFFRMEAPDSETGAPRQVIVFRLLPVGDVLREPADELELPGDVGGSVLDAIVAGSTEPIVTDIPVEQQNVEEVEVSRTAGTHTAERREQTLVLAFKAHLEAKGSSVHRFRARPPGEARPIVCDVFDETRNNLIEAKGTGARGEVRMAIGQLYDYARFKSPRPALAVLLPSRPRPDIEGLLAAAEIAAIWPDGSGFTDNASGSFV